MIVAKASHWWTDTAQTFCCKSSHSMANLYTKLQTNRGHYKTEVTEILAILHHFKCFPKTLFRPGLHTLINPCHIKVFTGTSSLLKVNQFPSTHASTSQACYSPSQMHYSHLSTLSFLTVPSSWNWEWRKKILRRRFGRRREKCFLVSGVLKFSMCQSKNYQLPRDPPRLD